ncbi:UreD urease accessory protein [Musa troglodytarum]|uniref:UreD urease accessory protein n=1 Tax=Musa troglodytarum TaxID=320322 RepID=A0A9E7H6B1_9LILI|nr:UreD urease accessory protein [Musa troglodytarum]
MAAPQPSQRRLPPRQVYKSVDSKCSEQFLEARVGRNALLAVIPDPVTCFSTASGRHESGERWEFDRYKSTNHIYLDGDQPLFLDSVLLDKGCGASVAELMQEYQVMAMVIISGPKLKDLRCQLQEEVKQMMSRHLRSSPDTTNRSHHVRSEPRHGPTRPLLIASCSTFGPQALGMVVRVAAVMTESVYMFLRQHLAALKPFLGASPYCQAGR